MKFRIISRTAMTRKEIFMSVTKWALYSLVLALSYTIQVTMPFTVWQPYLTLTVAVAVSFFENELSGVVFAAFAGMMHVLAMARCSGLPQYGLCRVACLSHCLR